MNYLEKYLKYKSKYLDYKKNMEQVGGVYMNPKYRTFINYRNTIRKYINENREHRKVFNQLAELLPPCNTSCWMTFMRNLSLTEYLATFNTEDFYLYPNIPGNDINFSTDEYIKPLNNIVKFNLKNNFISLIFNDILNFDYDIKDDIPDMDRWTTEVKSNHLKGVIKKIQTVTNYFKSKYNVILKFILFHTDRGYHFFLLNKTGYNKNLFLIELMMTLCNDQWYSAFCYSNGFALRLNPKKEGDFTAELSFNDNFLQAIRENRIIPDNKFDKSRMTKTYSFYSEIFKTMITFNYPDIADKSLFIIEPNVEYQASHIPNPLRTVVNDTDHTYYVFNKLCYHYYLVRYFTNFTEDQIMKIGCSIGNIVLGEESEFMINLRHDLVIIAEHFGLHMDESMINPLSFQNMPLNPARQPDEQPVQQPARQQGEQPVQQPARQPGEQLARQLARQPGEQPARQLARQQDKFLRPNFHQFE